MSNRRSLVKGLVETPDVREEEERFVFGEGNDPIAKPERNPPPTASNTPNDAQRVLPQMAGRVPLTIRCRPEIASAVKRVALNRQLDGVEPFHMQDILEQALENWLRDYA